VPLDPGTAEGQARTGGGRVAVRDAGRQRTGPAAPAAGAAERGGDPRHRAGGGEGRGGSAGSRRGGAAMILVLVEPAEAETSVLSLEALTFARRLAEPLGLPVHAVSVGPPASLDDLAAHGVAE